MCCALCQSFCYNFRIWKAIRLPTAPQGVESQDCQASRPVYRCWGVFHLLTHLRISTRKFSVVLLCVHGIFAGANWSFSGRFRLQLPGPLASLLPRHVLHRKYNWGFSWHRGTDSCCRVHRAIPWCIRLETCVYCNFCAVLCGFDILEVVSKL